jgi:hypothetical protein
VEGDLAAGKRTAAALGAWIVFEDETGQSMRPPRCRTWGRRGITPVIQVRADGSGSVSVAGLACYRPGHRTRLIYRLHHHRGRKGEKKAFTRSSAPVEAEIRLGCRVGSYAAR